jgi:hypothetical protein
MVRSRGYSGSSSSSCCISPRRDFWNVSRARGLAGLEAVWVCLNDLKRPKLVKPRWAGMLAMVFAPWRGWLGGLDGWMAPEQAKP